MLYTEVSRKRNENTKGKTMDYETAMDTETLVTPNEAKAEMRRHGCDDATIAEFFATVQNQDEISSAAVLNFLGY